MSAPPCGRRLACQLFEMAVEAGKGLKSALLRDGDDAGTWLLQQQRTGFLHAQPVQIGERGDAENHAKAAAKVGLADPAQARQPGNGDGFRAASLQLFQRGKDGEHSGGMPPWGDVYGWICMRDTRFQPRQFDDQRLQKPQGGRPVILFTQLQFAQELAGERIQTGRLRGREQAAWLFRYERSKGPELRVCFRKQIF